VHAPTEDKNDDKRQSFYEELEGPLYQFPNNTYLLGELNAKLGREDISKSTTGE
jgi:hypothetical protein